MKDLSSFSNLYSVSKTLRFELIPVGETLRHIEENGILTADEKLAESYKKMKKTIDEFHKDFIERSLSGMNLPGLESFCSLYLADPAEKKSDSYKKRFEETKASLRKTIARRFKDSDGFSDLDKKELIQQRLKAWIDTYNPELYFDESFRNFTTYFTGYNQNRMNMYSDEAKATAIAYRLIDENLPKFIDNIQIFKKVKETDVADCFPTILRDMEAVINFASLEDYFDLASYSSFLTQRQIDAYNTVIGGIKEGNLKKQGLNEYINLYNQKHPQTKVPKFKLLYKQILSDRVSVSWLPEQFENAQQLLDAVNAFYLESLRPDAEGNLPTAMKDTLANLSSCDAKKIYLRNDASLTSVSMALFGRYDVIRTALTQYYETVIDPDHSKKLQTAKTESAAEKLHKAEQAFVTGSEYHSVFVLQSALDLYVPTLDKREFSSVVTGYSPNCIGEYYVSDRFDAPIREMYAAYEKASDLLNTAHPQNTVCPKRIKRLSKRSWTPNWLSFILSSRFI